MKNLAIVLISVLCISSINAQVNTEKFRTSTHTLGFSLQSQLDLSVMYGNTDHQYISSQSRFSYNREEDYSFLIANGGIGKNNGKNYLKQILFHLRTVHRLSTSIQWEGYMQYDTDENRHLLQRNLIGNGIRIAPFDSLFIRVGLGVLYEDERYDLPAGVQHPQHTELLRLNSYATYSHSFTENAAFLVIVYFQPSVRSIDDHRLLIDSALKTSITTTVSFIASGNLRIDNHPPDGVQKTDVRMTFGLGITL